MLGKINGLGCLRSARPASSFLLGCVLTELPPLFPLLKQSFSTSSTLLSPVSASSASPRHSLAHSALLGPAVNGSSLTVRRPLRCLTLLATYAQERRMSWSIPVFSSRSSNLATQRFRYRSSGGHQTSDSSSLVSVALYAPEITRRHLF